jgi:V/A-type H+-transporting ATPase subunit K
MKRLAMLGVVLVLLAWPAVAMAQGQGAAAEGATVSGGSMPAHDRALVACFLACAVAFVTALSILGAGYAVAHVGAAAIGAASEKPEMMVKGLMFVALGEGLAILGLIIAFLLSNILGRIQL